MNDLTNPAGIRPAATAYMPSDELTSRIEAIATRLETIVSQRKELEEEEKFLRQRLATLCPMGTTKTGTHTVQVRENKRFDHNTAMAVLEPFEIQLCSVTAISAARAREALPPERYAACQAITGDLVVRVS